jgi:hypothetical protein
VQKTAHLHKPVPGILKKTTAFQKPQNTHFFFANKIFLQKNLHFALKCCIFAQDFILRQEARGEKLRKSKSTRIRIETA